MTYSEVILTIMLGVVIALFVFQLYAFSNQSKFLMTQFEIQNTEIQYQNMEMQSKLDRYEENIITGLETYFDNNTFEIYED